MIKLAGDKSDQRRYWRIYPTHKAAACAVKRFLALGCRYIVGWRDTKGGVNGALGYGVEADSESCDGRVHKNLWGRW